MSILVIALLAGRAAQNKEEKSPSQGEGRVVGGTQRRGKEKIAIKETSALET